MTLSSPTSIAFMNNKGGVGKTTLACNIANYLADTQDKQVLVVDLDPQCNATQLLLSDDDWDAVYGGDQRKTGSRTVLHAMARIRRGDSGVEHDFRVHRSERFRVDVLAGHPTMALLEDRLSSSWEDLLRGDLGGARRSHWLAELIKGAKNYDFIIVDAGPSLGALNRTTLLGVDAFVTPTAADLFSVFALDNIRIWMESWARAYERGMSAVREEYDDEAHAWGAESVTQLPQFIGFTIQQYVTKALSGGNRRKTNAYDHYANQIPERASALAAATGSSNADLNFGVVPYMFSMVPLAQARHAPIAGLTPADGLRGAQVSQQAKYREQLEAIGGRFFASVKSGVL